MLLGNSLALTLFGRYEEKSIKTSHTPKVIALILLGSLTSPSFADSAAERIESLEATVLVLEKRISALEGSSDQSKLESPKPKASGDWKNKSNWRLLSKGMSKDQIRAILGEPEKINASGPIENWRWDYPLGPSVTFYDEVLYGWDEK